MNRISAKVLLSCLALVGLAACDGDRKPPAYDLVGGGRDARAPDEAERLRKMQLVTVLDDDGAAHEIEASELNSLIRDKCNQGSVVCVWQAPACLSLCAAQYELCVAETALALTRPQAEMEKFPVSIEPPLTYRVPMQSASVRAAIAESGVLSASDAGHALLTMLRHMAGGTPVPLCGANYEGEVREGRMAGPEAAAGFARAFRIFRELSDTQVQASLDISDAELNSTTSPELAGERAITSWRLAAARALGGTAQELPFNAPNGAFCSRPSLTPAQKAAIAVLRDAAVDPEAVLLESLPTEQLLNGVAVTNGSVRERLKSFYASPGLMQGGTVEEQFDLDTTTFEEARAYLRQEIVAFSRSRTAGSPRATPDGEDSMYKVFAGTATPPTSLPPAYYGALVRANAPYDSAWPPPSGGDPIPGQYALAYAEFIWGAREIMSALDGIEVAAQTGITSSLSLIAAGRDLRGIVQYAHAATGQINLSVYGFSGSELKVANGEDQLRCAVQGTIEGAPCALSLGSFDFDFGPVWGFEKATARISGIAAYPSPRVYVLRKKSFVSAPQPGDYEVLLGFDRGPNAPHTAVHPIIAGVDEKLAAILEPNPEGCSRPRANCDGTYFDERIPLEDELADDGDGIENSWRHYLGLARQAADRADVLGVEYVRSSLEDAQRQEDVELRREQQLAQADAHLRDLQRLCGFDTDTRSLLKRIAPGAGSILGGGGQCLDDSQCGASFSCQYPPVSNPSGTGRCVLDLDKFLDKNDLTPGPETPMGSVPPSDPDIQRIRDCLDDSDDEAFVSLGNVPLCFWHAGSNANVLCPAPTEDDADAVASRDHCPEPLFKPEDTCAELLAPLPDGVVVAQTRPLGYFTVTPGAAPGGTNQDINEKILSTLTPGGMSGLIGEVHRDHPFDPHRLSAVFRSIDYAALPGGFGAITYQGIPIYKTGDIETGFITNEDDLQWPCDSAKDSLNPAESPASFNCSADADGHEEAKARLFRAAVAARSLSPPGPGTGYDSYQNLVIHVGAMKFATQVSAPGLPEPLPFPFPVTVYPASYLGECQSSESIVGYDNIGLTRIDCPDGTFYYSGISDWQIFRGIPLRLQRTPNEYGQTMSHLLADFNSVRPSAGPLGAYLVSGLGSATEVLAKFHWEEDGALVPGVEPGAHDVELTVADYVRALGLAANINKRPPVIDLSEAPRVTSIEDLEGVSLYMEKLATTIRSAAGSSIFAGFPGKVGDALRQEEASGSFPQFSGDIAVALSSARGALLRIRENAPLAANEVEQLAADVRELKVLLRKAAISQNISGLQLMSSMYDRITQCATSMATVGGLDPVGAAGRTVAAAMTCANSVAQIGIAKDIARAQTEDAQLNGELAINDFQARFSAHATMMQTLALHLAEAQDDLDAALATIASIRGQARSALVDALTASSFEATKQAEIGLVLGNLSAGNQIRYEAALKNARRLSFLAKRAIEQRLGVRLADLTKDYPLVDAPQKWEATACTFSGMNYASLAESDPDAPKSYDSGFIGDYVTKLENFIESYRLEHNFHEGTDTAVISLRDDIMGVKSDCFVDGPNLLYDAGQLDRTLVPGWTREGCPTHVVEGIEMPAPGCISTTKLADGPTFLDLGRARTSGYQLAFGSLSGAGSAVVQRRELKGGVYRFSWYTPETGTTLGGAGAGFVSGSQVMPIDDAVDVSTSMSTWKRRYQTFRLEEPGVVTIGFKKPGSGASDVKVSAPMLENLPDLPISMAFVPFVNTTDTTDQLMPACHDTDGAQFRSRRWTRDCVRLCTDGFASNCFGRAREYCYRQAEFGFSQRDIQLGKVLNFSGFARGNFNYRIDSVGVNFVGTGIRNCSGSAAPEACYGGGFVPFSLSHQGPFFVRNHTGADVQARVFDGNIEHARGLATERYLTNPLSDSDRALIEQYTRREFAGRPLDGNFILRVWEEEGVDFDAIQDVQIALNYRYWTKND